MRRRRIVLSEVEGRRDVAREREHQRRYAQRHGHFWRPCPLCWQEFGGHEAGGSIPTGPGTAVTICPRCTAERQQHAEELLRTLGATTGPIHFGRWGADGITHVIPAELPTRRTAQ
jgi:hypothetical protein